MNAPGPLIAEVQPQPARLPRLSSRDVRVLAVATASLWAANWTILTARAWADGQVILSSMSIVRAALCVLGCGFCWLIHQGISRLPLASFQARTVAAGVAALLAAEAYGWALAGIGYFLFDIPVLGRTGTTLLILGYYAWTFFAWTTLYLSVIYNSHANRVERRAAELQTMAQAAQLRALRYQLNPHFLFNTLNSLSGLILENRTSEANGMVERLADFLRSSLTTDPLAMIPLSDEVRLQELYLRIEQVRYPDLRLTVEVPRDTRNALVPALLLQPIVENAVRHAVAVSPGSTHIHLSARRDQRSLVLEIVDDGTSNGGTEGTGLGLRNVRERLQTIYGPRASMSACRSGANGYRVQIQLPLEAER
jgi:two-component system, LytTR family, sensor kinase